MNERDNDHITLLELRGFVSDNLGNALLETHAISKATQCKQYMFSLSLNPPKDHIATEDDFIEAADRAEKTLGLDNQPRAIVVHEKEGRRHAHVVWSRIDGQELRAINLPHYKNKLRDLSRDLFLDHGWDLPNGLKTYGGKSPLNFTLEEWQQAKRQNIDPREIKQAFRQAWERSDSLVGLTNALEDRGYFLARGDRRGFVALDVDGNVYALSKWSGIRASDVKSKLGSPDQLPSVDETKAAIRSKVSDQMRDYISQVKDRQQRDFDPLRETHRAMRQAQREERQKLHDGQTKRWSEETRIRSGRLNKGLRGLFDRLTGKAKTIQSQNELEARHCATRDQKQRDFMVEEQMKERRRFQSEVTKLRQKHKQERRILAQNVKHSMRSDSSHESNRSLIRDLSLSL
ncbi:MAG: relaxase/mobilization nuclease domain-containing protein [Cohaesibacter sp.]|nr:relaxase/mobilization nuclease domain-containing protein [Cohaesibacter sp.]